MGELVTQFWSFYPFCSLVLIFAPLATVRWKIQRLTEEICENKIISYFIRCIWKLSDRDVNVSISNFKRISSLPHYVSFFLFIVLLGAGSHIGQSLRRRHWSVVPRLAKLSRRMTSARYDTLAGDTCEVYRIFPVKTTNNLRHSEGVKYCVTYCMCTHYCQ